VHASAHTLSLPSFSPPSPLCPRTLNNFFCTKSKNLCMTFSPYVWWPIHLFNLIVVLLVYILICELATPRRKVEHKEVFLFVKVKVGSFDLSSKKNRLAEIWLQNRTKFSDFSSKVKTGRPNLFILFTKCISYKNCSLRLMYIGEVYWQKYRRQWQTTDGLCTCLGHLGRCDTDRIISISVTWPRQVRKVLSRRNIDDVFANKLRQCARTIIAV